MGDGVTVGEGDPSVDIRESDPRAVVSFAEDSVRGAAGIARDEREETGEANERLEFDDEVLVVVGRVAVV